MTIDDKITAPSEVAHAEAVKAETEPKGSNSDSSQTSQADVAELEDVPSPLEQQSLMQLTRAILNPNGDDPRIDQYITSSFSYILSAFYKMATATDKDVAAKEIADDLNTKFENWVAARESDKEGKEEKEDQKEEEKIEEIN